MADGILTLPNDLRERLLFEAEMTAPAECCGLLEGYAAEDGIVVTAVHTTANCASDPDQGFEIDAATHLRLRRELRGSGRAIVGCYHSHPNGRAEMSESDRAAGGEDGFVWLIIATGVINSDEPSVVAAYHGADFRALTIRGTS